MRTALRGPLWVLVLGLALSSLYQYSHFFFSDLQGPLIVNSILVTLLTLSRSRWSSLLQANKATTHSLADLWAWFGSKAKPLTLSKTWAVYTASLSPAIAALALGLATGSRETRNFPVLDQNFWLAILLIPIVEETLFRGFISRFAQTYFGTLSGIYWTSLLFAFVHAIPKITEPSSWGLPVGPFLLALCVEGLRVWSGRFWPAILFHVAANATVSLFFWLDPRWLSWLSPLYLN